MSNILELRGKQVQVSDLSFHFPKDPPHSDDDIVDREDTIAQIRKSIAVHEGIVKLGKSLIKALQGDIEKTMAARLADEESGQDSLPFEEEPPEEEPIIDPEDLDEMPI